MHRAKIYFSAEKYVPCIFSAIQMYLQCFNLAIQWQQTHFTYIYWFVHQFSRRHTKNRENDIELENSERSHYYIWRCSKRRSEFTHWLRVDWFWQNILKRFSQWTKNNCVILLHWLQRVRRHNYNAWNFAFKLAYMLNKMVYSLITLTILEK